VPAGAAILAPSAAVAPGGAYAAYLADGETVILALKPSLWFVFLKRAGWLATLAIVWSLLALIQQLGASRGWDFKLFPLGMAFIIAAVAVLAWLALDRLTRLYLLTDKRVFRVSGIFSRTTVEIPLQKVTTVVLHRTFTERLTGVGSILFTSAAAGSGGGDLVWYIIDQPVSVVRTVRETLSRYGGGGSPPPSSDGAFGAAQ